MMSASTGLDLLMKAETEGLDSEEELVELAVFLIGSGLASSTGSYQRLCSAVAEEYPDELLAELRAQYPPRLLPSDVDDEPRMSSDLFDEEGL